MSNLHSTNEIKSLSSPAMMNSVLIAKEAELSALQSNFDDYIESSRELEEELEAELKLSQTKLWEANMSNARLTNQIKNLTPQLASLEKALEISNQKLEEERKLRREAETKHDEAERRARKAEGSLDAMKEDYDIVHEKLALREIEIEELRIELEVLKERSKEELEDLKVKLQFRVGDEGEKKSP